MERYWSLELARVKTTSSNTTVLRRTAASSTRHTRTILGRIYLEQSIDNTGSHTLHQDVMFRGAFYLSIEPLAIC